MLSIFDLTRDSSFISKKCKTIGPSLVAKSDISVYIPASTLGTKLLSLDDRFYSNCTLMYTDGKTYAVLNIPAIIELGVTEYSKVSMKAFDGSEVECFKLDYPAGTTIHPTSEVPMVGVHAYEMINQYILMGRTIPFFDKDDFDSILDGIPEFCGFRIPEYGYVNHSTESVLRDVKDKQLPARLSKGNGYCNIPFSSVSLNVSDPIGKTNGGYSEEGMMSATVTTNETATAFESIVRA